MDGKSKGIRKRTGRGLFKPCEFQIHRRVLTVFLRINSPHTLQVARSPRRHLLPFDYRSDIFELQIKTAIRMILDEARKATKRAERKSGDSTRWQIMQLPDQPPGSVQLLVSTTFRLLLNRFLWQLTSYS